jgi:hypothetical protein
LRRRAPQRERDLDDAGREPGRDREPPSEVVGAEPVEQRAWFRELLVRLDVDDPDGLATQLMLLVDGAIAAAIVRGDPKVARAARAAAATLLEAARRPSSSPRRRGPRSTGRGR